MPSSAGEIAFLDIARLIEHALEELPSRPVRHFSDLYTADSEARELTRSGRRRERVSWFLAFAGFALLIILHEVGHFAAAKAVGMRVERFSLFFPPLLCASRWGRPSTRSGRSHSAAT